VKIRHRVLQDPHHRVVKELPKTISGKIKRAEIRKDAAQRHKWRHQDVAGMEWAGNE
jgi:acyl-coenzyme A synthetase/AMP-(fatty) acid ligase